MHYQEPIHRPDEVHDNRLAVGTVVEVDVDVVAGVRHVDDVFAVQGVDGLSESRAGLLGAEVMFASLQASRSNALGNRGSIYPIQHRLNLNHHIHDRVLVTLYNIWIQYH